MRPDPFFTLFFPLWQHEISASSSIFTEAVEGLSRARRLSGTVIRQTRSEVESCRYRSVLEKLSKQISCAALTHRQDPLSQISLSETRFPLLPLLLISLPWLGRCVSHLPGATARGSGGVGGEGGRVPDRKQGHARHSFFISKFAPRKDSIFCTLSAPLLDIRCLIFIYTSQLIHHSFVFQPSKFDGHSDGTAFLRHGTVEIKEGPLPPATVALP